MSHIKKVDLHVHTRHSNRPQIYMLSKVRTGECYTEPKTVYEVCKERGMDFVTITDHDTINGALEIAPFDDTFISEEITAFFPEDKTDVHIIALDISEAHHREISKLRHNIFDLAGFLRQSRIPHYVAHPLSQETRPLGPGHIERLILLFKHLEGRNGTRDMAGGLALQRILNQLTPALMVRWAEKYRLEPVDWDVTRHLTGGSDDHGRLGIARAWTEFDTGAAGVAGLREAFFDGRVAMGGSWGTPEALSHTIYYVTIQYFANMDSRSVFSSFIDEEEVDAPAAASPAAHRYGVLKDIVETSMERFGGESDVSLSEIIDASHSDRVQTALGRLGRGIVHHYLEHFFEEFISAVKEMDLDRAFDSIPGLLTGGSVLLPYLFGYRYHVMDREACERLTADMGFGYPEIDDPRVLIFSDTGFDVNGVTLSLRHITAAMREAGHDVKLVFCDNPPENQEAEWLEQADYVRVLPPVGVFNLPGYDEMEMGIPSLIDVMECLARGRVALVQISTPGPLGVVAGIAAKLMGIKVVANFHTEVHKFTDRIIGDEKITAIVSHYLGWFYRQMDRVIVPSRAAANSLEELEVSTRRLAVLPRGVDTKRFTPEKRNPACWRALGMGEGPKVIYVGRVSREKSLDVLLDAFLMVARGVMDAELAVIGDGPYLAELEQKYDRDAVHFLGYRHGEQLAEIYASADVLAFPSENDTFGNAVTEAHASGLPVVVVDKGGPKEQVKTPENGIVVPAGDTRAMAAAISTLLDNPVLARRMGEQGRRRVGSMSWRRAAETQWKFYMDAWGRNREDRETTPPKVRELPLESNEQNDIEITWRSA